MAREIIFEIEHLDFSYGKNKVLDDLSLVIEQGRFYGIVGPNGCGKTTLLDLMVANRDPARGVIKFWGKEIKRFKKIALAKEIALVPQDFYINFPFTVKEIVLMGRHPYIPRFTSPSAKDLKIVEEIMEEMAIDQFNNRYITELSGGEKQRVVFARALAQATPILILDEPTSNMDIQYALKILNTVADRGKREKRTVIAAMHNLNLAAAYCDRLVFMKSGKVVSEGDIEVLNEKNIKDVFEVEAKVYFDSYSNSKQVVFKRRIPT
jgi:iron complex transport system ATP-binding protein